MADSASEGKVPTLPGVLWLLATVIFRREAIMVVASSALLLAVGGVGVVWAQAKLDGGVAPIRVQLELDARANEEIHRRQAVEAEELRRRMANVERVALETNLNVRLLLEDRRILPITLEPTDGGR